MSLTDFLQFPVTPSMTATRALELRDQHLAAMRRLRLYHWQGVRRTRAAWDAALERMTSAPKSYGPDSDYIRQCKSAIEVNQAAWAVHMGFVQDLNVLFDTPSGDTADRDAMASVDRPMPAPAAHELELLEYHEVEAIATTVAGEGHPKDKVAHYTADRAQRELIRKNKALLLSRGLHRG